jgi:hypothetical protein
MILTSGERMVWAAAFVEKRSKDRRRNGVCYAEQAVCEACAAVRDLRRAQAYAGEDLSEEAQGMLRAMLGDEG